MHSVVRIQRLSVFAAGMAFLLCFAMSATLFAQDDDDDSNRALRDDLVPTPDQLIQKLSRLQGIELPKSMPDQLMELGKQFLEDLPPEQQEYLRGLAEDYRQGKNPELPPDLQGLADSLRQQMDRDGQQFNLEDLIRNLPGELTSPELSGGGDPSRIPNRNSQQRNPRGQSRPGQTQPDRDGSTSDPFDQLNNPPEPLFDPEEAKRIAKRLRKSMSDLPENESFEPNPDIFEPSEPDYSAEDSEEYIGNRFDRLLMDAVERQLNESEESRSRMADSVNGLFDGLVDSLHTQINERDWSESTSRRTRRLGSRLQDRIQSESEFTRGGGFWGRLGGRGGGGSAGFSGWWLLGLLLLVAGGAGLWMLRSASSKPGGVAGFFGRRYFRVPKIRTADELVRAVDGFLLARFGQPSNWWHSRRAETALGLEMPGKGSSISRLVDCYEYARYSEVGDSLSPAEISECTSILRELASTKTDLAETESQDADDA